MKKYLPLIGGFFALALFGIGCGPEGPTRIAAPATSQVPSAPSSPTVIPPPRTADFACANEYFPIKLGFGVDYVANRDGTAYASSMRVVAADGNEATIRYTTTRADGRTSDQHITCAPDGGMLADVQVDLSGSSSSLLNNSVVKATYAEGLFLPKELLPDTSWRTVYNIETHTQDRGMRRARLGDLYGKMVITHDAQDIEDVDTEAGRFRAMRVKTTTVATLTMPGGRATVRPVERTSTTIEWWAKEVGLVKVYVPAGGGASEMNAEAKAVVRP